ncbi:N-acetyltransferase [Tenacibaculum maritimum]|uniref:N-acetyltransferase n=1 Tax=Tenacibaculum maritimum TaxID=107401 RepID=UPI0012E589E0|nr:N-acetyltransferase [Tenacibaculum maritimum]CAA0202985.1 putative acetyltransferase [Tenacibaculum maritimum]
MLRNIPEIKLYGANHCHKTHYYQLVLDEIGLPYRFLDVEENQAYAEELRNLYINKKLNFPTITIGHKKLRNPYKEDILKWIHKLIPSMLILQHDAKEKEYTLNINGEIAKVSYILKNKKMYLVHAEIPYPLRGKGIGKELVLKTFEKLTEEGHKAVAVCSYIKAVKNKNTYWKNIIE